MTPLIVPDAGARTVIDILRWRGQHQADTLAYRFIASESDPLELAYGPLATRAARIASGLVGRLPPGDRVLLVFDPGPDYIAAFYGCLLAGVLAVPLYPPRGRRTTTRLRAIAEAAGSHLALTTTQLLTRIKEGDDFRSVSWSTIEETEAAGSAWTDIPHAADSPAFIQFTAGSTGTPRGILLTHANLTDNLSAIERTLGYSPATIGVTWLPPYHDMGLIGCILAPLFSGFPVTSMSPLTFLQQPIRWLEAITLYGATASGGPDFAYDLCTQKVTHQQRSGLDLRSWQVAVNGAEPIRADTLDRFTAAFAPCGFDRRAWCPCYGLAEATLMVSGGPRSSLPRIITVSRAVLSQGEIAADAPNQSDRLQLVSSGLPRADQTLLIVDPDTCVALPDGHVGEIWVSGPSVAPKYWGDPLTTENVFHATLAEDPDERKFLRTGDLGFIADGELFITGRIKDVIIVRGLKHYPQDIEQTVEASHPCLRKNAGAAFSVDIDSEERVVVVNEVDRNWREHDVGVIKRAVCAAVTEVHGIRISAVVLLKFGALPKTSSGKVQRSACKAAFVNGDLTTWDENP
jgi:acyl-CoA synthetase (AMP-forming)/AMP-acid ligase II